MKRTSIFLKANQIKELKKLSAKTRVPWANYVRDAVDEFLARQRKQKEKKL